MVKELVFTAFAGGRVKTTTTSVIQATQKSSCHPVTAAAGWHAAAAV
jgi:hypothetical protein